MFCPNCGFKLESSNKFCPECGNSIPTTETENKTKNKETPEQIKPKRKTHKHALAVVLTIVFVIGLVGGGLLLFGDKLFSKSYEDVLTTGYWVTGEDETFFFRSVDNNDTFDGIFIQDGSDIGTYIMGDDGTVTLFGCLLHLNETTKSYDYSYQDIGNITVREREDDSFYLACNFGEETFFAESVDYAAKEYNDMISALCFSEWLNFEYKYANVYDYFLNKGLLRKMSNQIQQDVYSISFNDYLDEDGDNMLIVNYKYGDEEAGDSYSDFIGGYYKLDFEQRCIYFDGKRFEFNDDFSQLYCEEEGMTLFRSTDFSLGKIADTDFPPGKFVERNY